MIKGAVDLSEENLKMILELHIRVGMVDVDWKRRFRSRRVVLAGDVWTV